MLSRARRVHPLAVTLTCMLALAFMRAASADGVSAYLPLNLEPEVERQIERVLILADEPILKRPFAIALVELALPEACKQDSALCDQVKAYLQRYSRDYGITHASATGSYTHGGGSGVVPNSYGMPLDSKWEVSARGFVQPNDHFLASAGLVAYNGRVVPSGSMLSVGFNWAQVDIGYRDHWWSPMTDSSMLIGTEAPTMPSVTLSNYEPLTRLGFQYELFLARMSRSDHILFGGESTFGGAPTQTLASGNPKLFGAHFSIEPISGWSIGVNRMLQYGGGGLPDSAHFLLKDFFKPAGQSQAEGNQQASYVTRAIFPGKTPFAVYVQYAGEDTSDGGSYLLGNTATLAGIDFPRIAKYFDLTYEVSEWQNSWYTNAVFQDGMVNDHLVLGHWGADQRIFGDQVGARSQMLRVGWEPPFGGYLEERARILVNQNYGEFAYKHYRDFMVRYSRPWNGLTAGGEASVGQDVYGKSFVRLSGFIRYAESAHTRGYAPDDDSAAESTADNPGVEVFADVGGNANKVKTDLQKGLPITTSKLGYGPHVGIGARRAVSDNNDLGVRVEFDKVDGNLLAGVRAIDYRHRFGEHFALGAFLGVARYDLATPAYSLYGGVGAQWRNVLPKWDIGADFRYAQNVARDHVLASDPAGVRPDSFYKIETAIFYISRRF